MNRLFKHLLMAVATLVMVFSAVSCDDNNNPIDEDDELYYDVLETFVDKTIIPTYKAMAEAAINMRKVNNELKENPTDEKMKEASDAWMAMRIWWEMNEAFLFGPIGENGYDIDGHIDSWPLELEEIKKIIVEKNGNITGAEARDLDNEVIGFHVAEYLLYRDGASRKVSDLTAAELKYLTAVTDVMVWDCILAYVSWAGKDNVTSEMLSVFEENADVVTHYNRYTTYHNYGTKFKNGTANPSLIETVREISVGCSTIAEEVGAVKIREPYDDRATEKVESWYSWHSLDDYCNNIESIKNAYLGGTNNSNRPSISLSTYIAKVNPELDERVKDKIENCFTKIRAIGKNGSQSFYEVVLAKKNGDNSMDEIVDAAADACIELRDVFSLVDAAIK